ncbi:MAG: ABC transporter permease [Ruminococcaceae bacterium]|nr:ABC transporter permease [Oscillospiraceae bacterium]
MRSLCIFIKRNVKLFFADKGMFFTSLITPAILLVLYVTFLANVYTDSLLMALPVGFEISQELLDGFAGAQLVSSILSVSCVTVAFCSNMLMVQDKANGTVRDITVSPIKASATSIAYYVATLISALTVCLTATAICLLYVAATGWYMTALDIVLLVLDVVLLCLFGVALSSIINFFLSTQGQISAVGTLISSGYGFLCGAYMPLSQFSDGLRNAIMFLPGTYGTALVRNHAMRGVLAQMEKEGLPTEFVDSVRDNFDCTLYFFENKIDIPIMYAVIGVTVCVLVAAYVIMNIIKGRKVR